MYVYILTIWYDSLVNGRAQEVFQENQMSKMDKWKQVKAGKWKGVKGKNGKEKWTKENVSIYIQLVLCILCVHMCVRLLCIMK